VPDSGSHQGHSSPARCTGHPAIRAVPAADDLAVMAKTERSLDPSITCIVLPSGWSTHAPGTRAHHRSSHARGHTLRHWPRRDERLPPVKHRRLLLAASALTLASCSSPVGTHQADDNVRKCSAEEATYSLTVTAQAPAGDPRVPVLSWDPFPAEEATTSTLQRDLHPCELLTLRPDFHTQQGQPIGIRSITSTTQSLDTTAGTLEVTAPGSPEDPCGRGGDGIHSDTGNCGQWSGWYLTFPDPRPGTFELTAPVDFGDGQQPSTLSITGAVTAK
jgi:hypothetical protein